MVNFGFGPDDGSDFVTAPQRSPLFGRTLAQAVGEALRLSGSDEVLEFGAGNGQLAVDLLNALDDLGVPCSRYAILEVSATLRERQQARLAQQAPAHAARVCWIDSLPDTFTGVALGNEVLDAMPVRLFGLDTAGRWFERGVSRAHRAAEPVFAWHDKLVPENTVPAPLRLSMNTGTRDRQEGSAGLLSGLSAADPFADKNGGRVAYLGETHEAAVAFIRTVCHMLTRGVLFLLDYGFPRREYYHPQRTGGTLMCHYRHHAHTDPFFYPGLQDITTHVEFSSIAHAAREAGAEVLGYTSQSRFLLNSGMLEMLGQIDPGDPGRFLPAANAVKTLLDESEMGELFKVIALGRGIPSCLRGFAAGDRTCSL